MSRRYLIAVGVLLLLAWLWLAPPRFVLNLVKRVDLSDPVAAGAALVEKYGCRDCHRIGGQGASLAPNLAGVTKRHDRSALQAWLRNPRAVKSNAAMPNFRLSDMEIDAILAYLQYLDTSETP